MCLHLLSTIVSSARPRLGRPRLDSTNPPVLVAGFSRHGRPVPSVQARANVTSLYPEPLTNKIMKRKGCYQDDPTNRCGEAQGVEGWGLNQTSARVSGASRSASSAFTLTQSACVRRRVEASALWEPRERVRGFDGPFEQNTETVEPQLCIVHRVPRSPSRLRVSNGTG